MIACLMTVPLFVSVQMTMLMKLQEVSNYPVNAASSSAGSWFTNSTGDHDLCRYGDNLPTVGSAVS
jgi:hypothetical protein